MTIEFQGVASSYQVSNGEGDRILKAIGYPTTEETAGRITVRRAQHGILKARRELQDVETLRAVWYLSDVVDELAEAGQTHLTWS